MGERVRAAGERATAEVAAARAAATPEVGAQVAVGAAPEAKVDRRRPGLAQVPPQVQAAAPGHQRWAVVQPAVAHRLPPAGAQERLPLAQAQAQAARLPLLAGAWVRTPEDQPVHQAAGAEGSLGEGWGCLAAAERPAAEERAGAAVAGA